MQNVDLGPDAAGWPALMRVFAARWQGDPARIAWEVCRVIGPKEPKTGRALSAKALRPRQAG